MKKFVSIILVAIMIAMTCAMQFSSSAFSSEETGVTDIPNIHIVGQGNHIEDADGNEIYADASVVHDIDLLATVKEFLPLYTDALLKGEWDKYNEELLKIVEPIYEKIKLDENGNPRYGTHISNMSNTWQPYQNRIAGNGKYPLMSYVFVHDWRLDPFETADILYNYIQTVKASTGKEKVNISARCEGANILAAYIDRYGIDDIECVSFNSHSLLGVDEVSALFSGNIVVDGESFTRWKNQGLTIENETLDKLLDSALGFLVDTYSFDGISVAITPALQKTYQETVTKVLLASYGTMPGVWASVGKYDYARAKKYIFNGVEDQYKGLIEKLDYYDEHVRQRVPELLNEAAANGLKIQVVSKYGDFFMRPITESGREVGDGMITTSKTSFGATVSEYGKTLSNKYIKSINNKGFGKYISPDKVIDASTALFPDTTWFVYNNEHRDFVDCVFELEADFFESRGNMTVESSESYPQFLKYIPNENATDGVLVPMTSENGAQADTTPSHNKSTMKAALAKFIRTIINFVRQLLQGQIKLNEIFA